MKEIILQFSAEVMAALETYASRRETTVEALIRDFVAERTLPIIESMQIPTVQALLTDRIAARDRYLAAVRPTVIVRESAR